MIQEGNDLAVMIRARYPYIYLNTYEENRAVNFIKSVNEEFEWVSSDNVTKRRLNRKIYVWSYTSGMVNLYDKSKSGTSQSCGEHSPVAALEDVEKCTENAIFILKDFHVFLKEPRYSYVVVRKMRDMLTSLKTSACVRTVIILSPVVFIPEEMKKEITVLDYPLPTEDDMMKIFRNVIRGNRLDQRVSDDELREIARGALGMTAIEAESAFCRAVVEQGRLSMDILKVIFEEKKQCIRKNGILEYVESNLKVSDIGGLDVLKDWLEKRTNSWNTDPKEYMLPAPKGVLLTGVPGCGKSLVAKTMSAAWSLPLVQLDMGRVYSGLVGSSEENMRQAISTAEAMAPCVLWIDEIEKGLAGTGTSNDGGTSSRVFGTLLTWMQEKTSTVFILATSNDIRGLKPELLRKGRFDEIFFVDLPTRLERAEILRLHVNKRMCRAFSGITLDDEFYSRLADMTNGFAGAELEAVVISALFEAYAGKRTVKQTDFYNAIGNTIPISKTMNDDIAFIREWAKGRAVSATSDRYRGENEDGGVGRILLL